MLMPVLYGSIASVYCVILYKLAMDVTIFRHKIAVFVWVGHFVVFPLLCCSSYSQAILIGDAWWAQWPMW